MSSCTVMLVYLHLLLNTLQCLVKCLKYIRILAVSLEWVRDWWNVYINKWGKEDLHVIVAESWFQNLALSKTLSFYMLGTEASMNKVSIWRPDGLGKAKNLASDLSREMGQSCMRRTHHWVFQRTFISPMLSRGFPHTYLYYSIKAVSFYLGGIANNFTR